MRVKFGRAPARGQHRIGSFWSERKFLVCQSDVRAEIFGDQWQLVEVSFFLRDFIR